MTQSLLSLPDSLWPCRHVVDTESQLPPHLMPPQVCPWGRCWRMAHPFSPHIIPCLCPNPCFSALTNAASVRLPGYAVSGAHAVCIPVWNTGFAPGYETYNRRTGGAGPSI